jgi:hypothetical protein
MPGDDLDWQPENPGIKPSVTLPDTSIALPRTDQRRDLYPIRQPEPTPRPFRQSVAGRWRRRVGF